MTARLSWAVRIKRAQARGQFTPADMRRVDEWQTCAIGERHGWHDIHEANLNATQFEAEHDLGLRFMEAVGTNDAEGAMSIYEQIQALP